MTWSRTLIGPPLKERADHLLSTVVSCFLWGAELWAPSRRAHDVEAAEIRWFRRLSLEMRSRAPVSPAAAGEGVAGSRVVPSSSAWERLCRMAHSWWDMWCVSPRLPPALRRT